MKTLLLLLRPRPGTHRTRRRRGLPALLLLAVAFGPAQAQPVADLFMFTQLTNGGTRLEATVEIFSNPAEGLGVATIVFTFNDAALQLPSNPTGTELQAGIDYSYLNGFGTDCYGGSTVTRPLEGEISININYSYVVIFGQCGVDGGTEIPTTGVDLVTVFFDISDPSASSGLVFNADPQVTALFADDDDVTPTKFINGTFTGADVPLPVELVSFEAQVDGDEVLLTWQTASETNNAGFETHSKFAGAKLENRDDPWQVLAFVEGHGTTAVPQSYRYRVEALAPGRYVFRLKQIDFDGSFAYSPQVEVFVALPAVFLLTAPYPNPATGQTRLSLMVKRPQAVEVALFDTMGRRVRVLFRGAMQAEQARALVFEAGDLPSGLYVIRAAGETFTATRTALLLR